mgnify:CR=1 FL=1
MLGIILMEVRDYTGVLVYYEELGINEDFKRVTIDKLIKEHIEKNNDNIELCQGLQNSMEGQFISFMSRILSSNYSISEFRLLKETLHKKNILPLQNNSKFSNCINLIFRFPSLIRFYEFIYQNIFMTCIFPYLSRN